MKVLQINFSDFEGGGGGAIAMYRLHQGLNRSQVHSRILSGVKTLADADSSLIRRNYRMESGLKKISSWAGLNEIHSFSSFGIQKEPFYLNADILNFHIIHSGYFSYLALPALTKNKPAVFTLHDMWSFTGHCAYSYDCDRWKMGCGQCPYPNTYPAISRDNTHLEWKIKNWIYSRSNLAIVTPSKWLMEQAQQSMLNRFPIHHIPYGLDTDAYQPLDPEQCRSVLGIPANKKVLLFAAATLSDPRKGADLLLQALSQLPESLKQDIMLLTLGGGGEKIVESLGMQILSLGYISSDRLKSMAYSAADLFLFPTRADNLPLVLQESIACGTPIVSFKAGGVPDLVRPGSTGYLAAPEDVTDFRDGVVQLLDDQPLRQQMAHHCRSIAVTEYSLELQAKRYIDLYRQRRAALP